MPVATIATSEYGMEREAKSCPLSVLESLWRITQDDMWMLLALIQPSLDNPATLRETSLVMSLSEWGLHRHRDMPEVITTGGTFWDLAFAEKNKTPLKQRSSYVIIDLPDLENMFCRLLSCYGVLIKESMGCGRSSGVFPFLQDKQVGTCLWSPCRM